MPPFITKSSGLREQFSSRKLQTSLQRAGADTRMAREVAAAVGKEKPASTEAVHQLAMHYLRRGHRPLAARYNLKRALLQLGPSGFPFERYVGELLKAKGYRVQVGQTLRGKCVTHEVDVIAEKDNARHLIECKFHNSLGQKSDVKVALYIKARFEDLDDYWKATGDERSRVQHMWIVTNTEFTSDAIQYSRCSGVVHLMSWSQPRGESLAEMIDSTGLHPVTALTSLQPREKAALIRQGIVLCRDVAQHPDQMRRLGLRPRNWDAIAREAGAVCALRNEM